MNFQEKLSEASAELRAQAAAVAARAKLVDRVEDLKKSLSALDIARRAFGKVARRHAGQFMKQNSTLVSAAHKDVAAIARATWASLSARQAPKKTRRAPASRRRSSKAA